ncbi:hypothetical protein [Roseibium sp. RKSG952]|uniref:hypothetical protein n=1 Tax=Roseibium sp. RKSG952 TaxID=2529384 RepID=UPI0012BCA3BE|nr:hypothetical protein [Roseibium sp. RKSG952]MTI00363.1 hypothetical protein [Roseibium sp. RKSG952]
MQVADVKHFAGSPSFQLATTLMLPVSIGQLGLITAVLLRSASGRSDEKKQPQQKGLAYIAIGVHIFRRVRLCKMIAF